MGSYIFTSESVTEGHPDKICDQIADAVLDAVIEGEAELAGRGYVGDDGSKADPEGVRCACEAMVTTGMAIISGEMRTHAWVDVPEIARGVIRDIGYDRAKYGFDCDTCGVLNSIRGQSGDIAMGVDSSWESRHGRTDAYSATGAGDQGMVFGYACNETDVLMPMPIYLAHSMAQELAAVRKDGTLPYLWPDGKTQVSVRYADGRPVEVETVVVSAQHSDEVPNGRIASDIRDAVVLPVLETAGISVSNAMGLFVNPTGRFTIGGPQGDVGLTGRKLMVDTYGGMGRHGGGSFSGKDCTKVDRSAAYAARWAAKNVVAAGLAERCEIQIAYAIGVANPVSITVDTFGTSTYPESVIEDAVRNVFNFRPAAIIDALDLRRPIYRKTSNYGHFGRELPEFTWERVNRIDDLKYAVKKARRSRRHQR